MQLDGNYLGAPCAWGILLVGPRPSLCIKSRKEGWHQSHPVSFTLVKPSLLWAFLVLLPSPPVAARRKLDLTISKHLLVFCSVAGEDPPCIHGSAQPLLLLVITASLTS